MISILEVGAIIDGLPIYRLNLMENKESSQWSNKSNLQSALLYAIQSVAQGAFSDQFSQIFFRNIVICLDMSNAPNQKKTIILYTILDKKTKIVKKVSKILKKLSKEIEATELKLSLNRKKNEIYFSPIFQKAFSFLFLNEKKRGRMLFT